MGRPRSSTKKAKPERAIGYCRVSTDGQADKGVSLSNQKEKLRLYADLHDIDLIDIVTETASARTLERPKLQRALQLLAKGKADALLIYNLDRLTRSVSDLGKLLKDHFDEQAGHHLLSVSDHLDTSSAAGRLSLNVLISVSQWEREAIAERTKSALAELRRQGLTTGGSAPYGYRKEGRKLVPVPKEQKALARARELQAADPARSQQSIADALTGEGFKPRTGTSIRQSHVFRWLRQPPRPLEEAAS